MYGSQQVKTLLAAGVVLTAAFGTAATGAYAQEAPKTIHDLPWPDWQRDLIDPSCVETDEHIQQWEMYLAARSGDYDTVKSLLDEGISPEFMAIVPCMGDFTDVSFSPLAAASSENRLDIMRLLIDSEMDVNFARGIAIRLAAQGGHYDAVKLLLDSGANVMIDEAILMLVHDNDDVRTLQLLLDTDVDLSGMGSFILERAAEEGQINSVRLLLDRRIGDLGRFDDADLGYIERRSPNGPEIADIIREAKAAVQEKLFAPEGP